MNILLAGYAVYDGGWFDFGGWVPLGVVGLCVTCVQLSYGLLSVFGRLGLVGLVLACWLLSYCRLFACYCLVQGSFSRFMLVYVGSGV